MLVPGAWSKRVSEERDRDTKRLSCLNNESYSAPNDMNEREHNQSLYFFLHLQQEDSVISIASLAAVRR